MIMEQSRGLATVQVQFISAYWECKQHWWNITGKGHNRDIQTETQKEKEVFPLLKFVDLLLIVWQFLEIFITSEVKQSLLARLEEDVCFGHTENQEILSISIDGYVPPLAIYCLEVIKFAY